MNVDRDDFCDTGVRFDPDEDMEAVPTNLLTLPCMIPATPVEIVVLSGTPGEVEVQGQTTCNLNMVLESVWRQVPTGCRKFICRGTVADFRAWSPSAYDRMKEEGQLQFTPVTVVHDKSMWEPLGLQDTNGVARGGLDSIIAFVGWVMLREKHFIALDTYLLGSYAPLLKNTHPMWARIVQRARVIMQGSVHTQLLRGLSAGGSDPMEAARSGLKHQGIFTPFLRRVAPPPPHPAPGHGSDAVAAPPAASSDH